MSRYEFTLYTDHFQFYLQDSEALADTSSIWTDQTIADHLAVGPGLIAVGTVRYGGVIKVIVEIQEARPPDTFELWDQVAECSITVTSGELTLMTPEMGEVAAEPPILVARGTYRALVYYGNLDSITDENATDGVDNYRLILWPGEASAPFMLKRWHRAA